MNTDPTDPAYFTETLKTEASEPVNIPEIQRHTKRLDEATEAVTATLEVLEKRVSAILKPCSVGSDKGRQCAPTVAASTALGGKLSATSERLYEIAERIKGITERVEV